MPQARLLGIIMFEQPEAMTESISDKVATACFSYKLSYYFLQDTRNLVRLRLNNNCFRTTGGEALGECLGTDASAIIISLSIYMILMFNAQLIN